MAAKKNAPADPAGLPHLTMDVTPFTGHTVVTISVSTRVGPRRSDRRLVQWSIPLTRSDLAGHNTDDQLLSILEVVVHRIEQRRRAARTRAREIDSNHTAVGPGAPASGATGAVQDPLPGMPADSGTPGGVDTV